MDTFGEQLRQAIDSLGLPPDEVASATGLGIEDLRALVRNDFGSLPDDEIVTKGLRSLAQLVGVDPDDVIEDYLQERERWQSSELVEVEVDVGGAGSESPLELDDWLEVVPPRPKPGRKRRTVILATVILALAIVALLHYWSRTSTASASRQPAVTQATPSMRQTEQVKPESPRPAPRQTPSPSYTPSRIPDAVRQDPSSRASIPEHGVGKGVVQRKLVGRTERFTEGERVWFWTLVQGGAAGERIDHVWLHEDEEAFRVTLRVGGARWRTQSYNDLSPGSNGHWAVEARDEAGRVLARQEFRCAARP